MSPDVSSPQSPHSPAMYYVTYVRNALILCMSSKARVDRSFLPRDLSPTSTYGQVPAPLTPLARRSSELCLAVANLHTVWRHRGRVEHCRTSAIVSILLGRHKPLLA